MISPKTPQELAQAIEALVASYLVEARRIARLALDESFARTRGSAPVAKRAQPVRARQSRRGAAVMAELREKLFAQVSAQPGETMPVYAAALGVPVRSLTRPMSKLRRDGQVRCVGERNRARYFPLVIRPGR